MAPVPVAWQSKNTSGDAGNDAGVDAGGQ